VVYPAILEQGAAHLKNMTADDLHEYFLGEVWGWEKSVCFGRIRHKPKRRSHNLKVSEFMEYVGEITARMAEIGIVVPEPGETL
jgi:hypothetical protein